LRKKKKVEALRKKVSEETHGSDEGSTNCNRHRFREGEGCGCRSERVGVEVAAEAVVHL